MGFFSNWFKGLQKEEQTNNDEYVEYLLKELEKAKTENAQALEKEKRLMAQIEAAQENQKDDADREKAELRAQVEAMREELEKNARRLEEGAWQKEKELKELKERLKEYESSYPPLSKYISQAKEDADAIRLSATSEAEEILLSGCAHNGILNILDRYREIRERYPDFVISGFHMMKDGEYTEEDKKVIRQTARELQKMPTRFVTGHCTGIPAYKMLKEILGEQIRYLGSGEELDLSAWM